MSDRAGNEGVSTASTVVVDTPLPIIADVVVAAAGAKKNYKLESDEAVKIILAASSPNSVARQARAGSARRIVLRH